MNCKSPFSVVLAAILAAACSKTNVHPRNVDTDGYKSDSCWFDDKHQLDTLMVLARDERTAVPYFISSRCILNHGYSSLGEGIIDNMNVIQVIDGGPLKKKFSNLIISNSLVSEQPMPSLDSKVFYLKANVRKLNYKHPGVYELEEIVRIADTKISFARLLQMPLAERQELDGTYAGPIQLDE